MRYRIKLSKDKIFQSSFYDTNCLECNQPINSETGDPVGFLDYKTKDEHGPLCLTCTTELKKPPEISID